MSLHADQYGASRLIGNAIRKAGEAGFLSDTTVQSSTTLASLEAVITNASTHADQQPLKARINKALDIGGEDSELTTTIITNATGVANLATNTQYDQGRTYGSVD